MLDKALLRLSGIRQLLGLLVGLDGLQAIFIIGQAIALSSAITHLWQGELLTEQGLFILLFALSWLGRHGIRFVKDRVLDRFAAKATKGLRQDFLAKVFALGPQIVKEEGSGNVVTMALDGMAQVETYLQLILNKMINLSISPWLILAVIFILDWESGAILLIIFPLIILFMVILGLAAQARADKQYASYQVLSNHFLDSLRGIDTLRFFGLSKAYAKSIFRTSEAFRRATMGALRIGILSTFALDFFTTLSIAIVAVLLGLRLIHGDMSLFPALTVLILAPEYFLPVRNFSSDYHATLDGKNAFQAIQKILQRPHLQDDGIAIDQWSQESQVVLDEISLAYGEKSVLRGLSFSVTGYQKIGIVGMSGSGKSTLINLLSGFLSPTSGKIRLNDQCFQHLKQDDWQGQLHVIPQDPYLFNQSLRDNIAFYHPQADDQAILEAVAAVGLGDLLAQLPEGLDTRIGNGDRPLSGGQAQRIALARAFLDDRRRILLFDEPTAHLDIETELALKETMLPLMDNRLVFFATHRLHWLQDMDQVLVLDQGQLVEQGSYQELMAKKGYFYHLKGAMGGNHD